MNPEKNKTWTCDICGAEYENKEGTFPQVLEGYHERICDNCFYRGWLWSIKEAYRWREQVAMDRKRKPKEA